MNLDEAKQLVDYFVRTSGGNLSIEIASGAVAVSLISILITVYSFHQQHSHSIYTYLAGVWYDILNTTIDISDTATAPLAISIDKFPPLVRTK